MNRRALLQAMAASALLGPKHATLAIHSRVYAQPSSEQTITLPRDHGVHLAFRTEWWYFTGWFTSPGVPQPFGVQITFFRSAPDVNVQNPSQFAPKQLLLAHAALALPNKGKLVHSQIARRAGSGGAYIKTTDVEVLNLTLPNWHLQTQQGEQWHCNIQTQQLGLDLRMVTTQAPWLQGAHGYSRKGPLPSQSRHYMTLPHMQCTGEVRVDGKTFPAQGLVWMDHEWSSTVLAPEAQGWDWVGLHGSNGESLMAFQIRHQNPNNPPVWTHSALRPASGQSPKQGQAEFKVLRTWKSSSTGVQYPVAQQLTAGGLRLVLEPLMDDQELDGRASTGTLYWEGAVRVKTEQGEPWGQGYLEMTGYDRPMKL
ncbi:lipocalin-like domain-containing protein [Limnobacter sp.]|uniref:lipocalin-like domain-containing protein n=1 Tax=Limnobacter sp. TaxID=2003368 RepID=UPI0035150EBB